MMDRELVARELLENGDFDREDAEKKADDLLQNNSFQTALYDLMWTYADAQEEAE